MKFTIKDLAEGKCAVKNDGTLEELHKVLKLAFPKDNNKPNGNCTYYYALDRNKNEWISNDDTTIPIQSVKDFLIPEEFNPKPEEYVWVSHNNMVWHKRIFIGKVEKSKRPYITILSEMDKKNYEKGYIFACFAWEYIRSFEEELVHLTIEDISAGKGVGVPPHLIRIKTKE